MIKFAADENLKNHIIRGLRLRYPTVDIVRIQDHGLSGMPDPVVLEWCAIHERILLTHDVSTITHYAYERIQTGAYMPGVIEIPLWLSIKAAIDNLALIYECSKSNEWEAQVIYLPLD